MNQTKNQGEFHSLIAEENSIALSDEGIKPRNRIKGQRWLRRSNSVFVTFENYINNNEDNIKCLLPFDSDQAFGK